jgi:hypothetical protein
MTYLPTTAREILLVSLLEKGCLTSFQLTSDFCATHQIPNTSSVEDYINTLLEDLIQEGAIKANFRSRMYELSSVSRELLLIGKAFGQSKAKYYEVDGVPYA